MINDKDCLGLLSNTCSIPVGLIVSQTLCPAILVLHDMLGDDHNDLTMTTEVLQRDIFYI